MRRRLALTAAAVTAMVVISFVVPLAALLRTSAVDHAVNTAEVQSRSLGTVLATESDTASLEQVVAQANATGPRPVSVVLADGRVVGVPVAIDREVVRARGGQAFTASAPNGGRVVFVPVRRPDGTLAVVRVLVPRALLQHGVLQAWLVLAGLGVALVVLAVVVTDRLVRPMVASMERLSAVTHRLRGGELDARIQPDGPPEVKEVGLAVNLLADQIGELLRAEREAAADVSHRLRTPMTALRLSVETLPATDEATKVTSDLEGLEHSVDQVIREMRRPVAVVSPASDLAAVVSARAVFWSVLAEEQGRAMTVDVPGSVASVALPWAELDATIDALLNNVFAHTEPGVPLSIRVRPASDHQWLLTVEDGGPGFGAAASDPPSSKARRGSTGLGIDIARRSAERSGGSIRTGRSNLGGALVELRLGSPPSSA
jgi:signal transduction histidine kinase